MILRKIIHVMLAIVALLIIWQFRRIALIVGTQANDCVLRLRFSGVIAPMKRVERHKRIGRCDEE